MGGCSNPVGLGPSGLAKQARWHPPSSGCLGSLGQRTLPSGCMTGGLSAVREPISSARPSRRRMTLAAALVALSLVLPAAVSAAKPPNVPPNSVNVQLLAINDFHG